MVVSQRKGKQPASRLAFAVHVGILAVLAAHAPVHAVEKVSSAIAQEFIAFHIPAQPLDKAVLVFAEQAGLQVLFDSQMLRGLTSQPLNGDFGVQEGLARLLGSNPVEYRFTGERQVTLTRVSGEAKGALALGTTSVTASENGNGADWVYQTPQAVSVITREQINKRAPRHAADMLEETPGVYTAVDQRDPGLSINIRGVQDYGRVNMNVDGMRQNFNVNGHQHRNGVMLIDPEMVSSIEIDKGSQSTLGGAGVIGGIATFRTLEASDFLKDGKEYGGRIRAGSGIGNMGNGTYFNGGGVFAFGNDIGDALFAVSERHFGNYRSGRQHAGNLGSQMRLKDVRPEAWKSWLKSEVGDAGSVTRSQMAKFGLNLPNDQRVQLSYLNTDSDSNDAWTYFKDDESGYDYVRHSKNNLSTANYAIDYSWNPDNELIDLKAKLYYVDTQLDRANARHNATANNAFGAYKDRFQTETWGGLVQNTSLFNFDNYGQLSVNYGLEMYQDTFTPRTNKVAAVNEQSLPYVEGENPSGKRTMASLFSNLEYDYNGWLNLSGGLRYDRYRLEGKTGMTLYEKNIVRYENGVPVINLDPAKRVEKMYDVDNESGRFSPTFGIAIKPGVDWLQLYSHVGKGWRPPAVTEVFMTGRPHGGEAPERVFPNPFLKAEESKDWEVGFNIFKESLFFNNDRLGMKVSYFDNRIKNFSFMQYGISLPETTTGNFGDLAYVNNLSDTRFRGVEYQANYDMGRVYTNLSYTHMIGSNDFCSKRYYMGGAKKYGKKLKSYIERYTRPDGKIGFRPVSESEWLDDEVNNNAVDCGGIMGNATYMPADRGSLTVGARFLERRLDAGVRLRYSPGNGKNLNAHSYKSIEQAMWPKYSVYDLYASYWMTDDFNITLVMENATDEAYFVAMGDANNLSLARGRTLSGMLEYKF